MLGPGLGRRKKIEKKKQKAPQTEKKKPVYLRPLLPGEVVWAKIPSYPWWPAQVRFPWPLFEANRKHQSRCLSI